MLERVEMDLRSGHPFWLVRDGLPAVYPELDHDIRCDVLVVGAGITGSLVAWHLQRAGLATVVVDRREVAWGSTAASTSLLQYEIDTPLVELSRMLGWDHAASAYLACRDAIGKLSHVVEELKTPCDFSLKPSLYLAKHKKDLAFFEREVEARQKVGIEVEFLTSGKLSKRMNLSNPGGIWSRDGAQVDVYALTHALLKSSARQGLEIYDRTELVDYRWGRKESVARTAKGQRIRAGQIVFATGYETQTFLPRIVSLHSTFAFVTEPVPGKWPLWKEDCLIWEHADPYLYVRTTEDRRILVGGADEEYRNPKRRDAVISLKTKILERKFRHLFPHLHWETAFAWAGTFGATKDGLAYIGCRPDFPHAWFALGFGGNGITYGILAAEIVRDGILGRPNPHAKLFAFNR